MHCNWYVICIVCKKLELKFCIKSRDQLCVVFSLFNLYCLSFTSTLFNPYFTIYMILLLTFFLFLFSLHLEFLSSIQYLSEPVSSNITFIHYITLTLFYISEFEPGNCFYFENNLIKNKLQDY